MDEFADAGVLSLQPWPAEPSAGVPAAAGPAPRAYRIEVADQSLSPVLEAVVPVLGRLLQEKTAQVRARKLEQLVELMTTQMVVPSPVEVQMAGRIAVRHAELLNEFGFATAEQLADMNQSRAANRHALADNWKKRRQVFAVRHRDEAGRTREVYPLFQFRDGRPLKAVQPVIEAFGEGKDPWKLALWFTSNNGWLPQQARPVDLLDTAPESVVEAAHRDAGGSAA
ncbi:hypothetical protein [Azohydromonas caseinilytica]|uniref:Antitoxin Xre/MbcA/ParS-like toxin-binding domain-containing protein n=1 Tax=Azohydromonas caseinilytica TaxID=2728836 RepID=A0A848F9E6_9BURK|nr:hypothetical protein [Azohydromonas caseinilytica]NML15962.1 hypothetical protein [Azohydromonas caseinilytica]